MKTSFHRLPAQLQRLRHINRNIGLLFLGSSLNGLSNGIFTVVFNLYILGLGISPEVLGGVLSASPFAQAIGSIPMGVFMERIGYKKIFIFIYGVTAVSRLVQIATTEVPLIALAAFVGGLALSGDFVVRLPFLAANSLPDERNRIYSLSSILFSVTMAIGALFAGFAPNIIQALAGGSLVAAYQVTLYIAGLLSVAGFLPFFFISDVKTAKPITINLAPYLWGMDRFTIQQAVVSLFVGLAMGLTTPFMNVYYVYHLGASREFFGIMSAFVIIPAMVGVSFSPILARRFGSVRIVTILRLIIPAFILLIAASTNPWIGTLGYWGNSTLMTMSQPLSFAFAMLAAAPIAKAAASAWLNVTFWMGVGISAPLAGFFIAKNNYEIPLIIAATAIFSAGVLNDIYFRPVEVRLAVKDV